jgi:hypothetical protein
MYLYFGCLYVTKTTDFLSNIPVGQSYTLLYILHHLSVLKNHLQGVYKIMWSSVHRIDTLSYNDTDIVQVEYPIKCKI